MKTNIHYLYDGSFEGLLSCVFTAIEEKVHVISISIADHYMPQLFYANETIYTDFQKARRVWTAYNNKKACLPPHKLYYAFLSEIKGIELKLLKYLQHVFSTTNESLDYSDSNVLTLSQVAKMVGREKHRMEAFVRFKKTKDKLYVARIEPDFNVLPLIKKHFKNRYADQMWLIYDIKRNYGIHYDLDKVTFVLFDNPNTLKNFLNFEMYDAEEITYQKLWTTYFHRVNIKSRKNTTLHKQHIPTRYWKYLTEKTVI